jgi:hypothetical protein
LVFGVKSRDRATPGILDLITHVLPSDTTVKLLAGSHAAEYAFYLAHAFNFRYYQEWTYWLAEYNYMNGSSAR